MSDFDFILNSSTRALTNSEEAAHLLEQKQRVEHAVIQNDSALTLDTSKAFLETTFKTILNDREVNQLSNLKLNQLFKKVRTQLPLNRNDQAREILEKVTNSIVNGIGDLRNKFGAASHGDDGYFENPIEMPEAEMAANLVDSMVGFLYRKHKADGNPELAQRIYYNDYPEFNGFLDLQYEGYQLKLGEKGVVELTPSELIFQHDESLYKEMLLQYISTEEEDIENDTEINIQTSDEAKTGISIDGINFSSSESIKSNFDIQTFAQVLSESKLFIKDLNDQQRIAISEFIVDYALNKTGIDWQIRESIIARFRTQIRRQLKKIKLNENLIENAVEFLIEKAIELSPNIQEK